MSRPAAPAGLGARARKLWTATTTEYELGDHELVILEGACREVDIVDRLEKRLKDEPLLVAGSMGQPTANPLLAEVRQHRSTVAALIKSLKLPEGEGAGEKPANPRSTSARAAANARWGSTRRGA